MSLQRGIGQQRKAKLPPDDGLAVLRDNWNSVTNVEARQQLLKAFTLVQDKRLAAVSEQGLLDPAPPVQAWALTYLAQVTLRDFSSDYNSAREWLAGHCGTSLDAALADGLALSEVLALVRRHPAAFRET